MAVFTEAELKSSTTTQDLFAMLEGANYLTEDEARIQPQLIPVKENSRLQGHTVRFEDIATLAEAMDVDYISAMQAVAESNHIDYDHLCVVVNEADIIMDPDICGQLQHIVVAPVSETALGFAYTNAVLEAYFENGDDAFLEAGILENAFLDEFLGLTEEGEAAPAEGEQGAMGKAKAYLNQAWEAIKSAPGKGANFVSEQIAALHRKYNEIMAAAKAEKEAGTAGKLKSLAVKIDECIHKLMDKIKGGYNAAKEKAQGAYNAVKEKVSGKPAEAQA